MLVSGAFYIVLCAYLATMTDLTPLLEQLAALSPEDKAKAAAALAVKQELGAATTAEASKPSLHGSWGQAKLSNFSGDTGAKGEVNYEQWKFEVKSMVKDKIYHEGVILQAIRRSLRGSSSEVLMTLGEDVTVEEVLAKFDHLFGNVLPPEIVLEQFYSARQKDDESVTLWVCRLEELLAQVSRKQPALLSKDTAQGMLRTKFYSGLRSGVLRNAVRHKFDSDASYDDLLVLARTAELEERREKETEKKAKVSQAVVTDGELSKKMDRLLSAFDDFKQRLGKLESQSSQSQASQSGQSNTRQQEQQAQRSDGSGQGGQSGGNRGKFQFRGKCYKCGKWGHRAFECPNSENSKQPASGGSR